LPSLEALRAAIADNLSTIPDVQVSPYVLGAPTPPAIQIQPGMAEYHQTFGAPSAEWWEFRVHAFVANTNDIASQRLLDRMLESEGSVSVKAALESDTTLNGLVDDLIVVSRTGYQTFVPEGRGPVLGAEWVVRVFI